MLIAVAICGYSYAEGGRLSRHMGGWQVICWALVLSLDTGHCDQTADLAAYRQLGLDRADIYLLVQHADRILFLVSRPGGRRNRRSRAIAASSAFSRSGTCSSPAAGIHRLADAGHDDGSRVLRGKGAHLCRTLMRPSSPPSYLRRHSNGRSAG